MSTQITPSVNIDMPNMTWDNIQSESAPQSSTQPAQPQGPPTTIFPAEFAQHGIKILKGPALDRRTTLAHSLEEARRYTKVALEKRDAAQKELDQALITENNVLSKLSQIDDYLQTIEMLAESSRTVEPLLSAKAITFRSQSQTGLTADEMRAIFKAHPNTNLSTQEIVELSGKPGLTRTSVSWAVNYLVGRESCFSRVSEGVYRYSPEPPTPVSKPDTPEVKQPAVEVAPVVKRKPGRPKSVTSLASALASKKAQENIENIKDKRVRVRETAIGAALKKAKVVH